MRQLLTLILLACTSGMLCHGEPRHFTVADGLPTGEVQQIVELPNGQLLVNCEGVFCITNGAGFDVVGCDFGHTFQLPVYADSYGQQWQGDSLLWLRDFYRVYLFDARRRCFRYDIEQRLVSSDVRAFVEGRTGQVRPDERQRQAIDALHLVHNSTCAATDRQGGLWIGTRTDGIVYLPPRHMRGRLLTGDHWLIGLARSATDRQGAIWRCRADGVEREQQGTHTLFNTSNVAGLPYNRTTFIQQLSDGRYLLCDSLSTLGYFDPDARQFVSLTQKLPALQAYRHFVGACPVDDHWTVVYAQNGACLLDTRADTLATFIPANDIARYATKYNCMLNDSDGNLWIGTQNGLFRASSNGDVQRVDGLTNNCIRSLVADAKQRVWAGTSCGISRITPSVVNLGTEDGVPRMAMMERSACLTDKGQLVFAMGGSSGLIVHPDSLALDDNRQQPVVITGCWTGVTMPAAADKLSLLSDDAPLRLSHRQNDLSLQFSTLDYATPSHNRYRYRLYPLEQTWNTVGDGNGQGTVSYASLPPGRYCFEVQASSAAGQWGEPTTLDLTILPPWWLTWWAKTFYTLMALLAIVVLIGLYLKKRRRKMERDNEEQVNRLFELRDEARHQFAQAVNIDAAKVAANTDEAELAAKLLKAIEEHIDDADYTVDLLAADIGMSRANLYKKTSLMLGITPNDFMRNVRLKHAAKLLEETNDPVSQIAMKVGFQTSRYFSQCFRQMFGVTPTEYRTGH
ncbi:MAG: helix-turn-helix domain-containing protein [Prevotella sp.]|nr:helix-turn-helix domain-containing protein [Prevotella sp.]